RSDRNAQLPLRTRLAHTNRPERKYISDMRYTSCHAQNRSRPSQRWLSMMGVACHSYGGLSNRLAFAGSESREAKEEWNASTIRMTTARRLLSARLVLDIEPPGMLADASGRRGNDDARCNIHRLPGHRQRARQAAVSCIDVGDLGQVFRIP